MKKLYTIVFVSLFFSACKKDIKTRSEQYGALNPIQQDENAGTWLPILLTAPNEFAVPAPDTLKSANYLSELIEIKAWQKDLSDDDKQRYLEAEKWARYFTEGLWADSNSMPPWEFRRKGKN